MQGPQGRGGRGRGRASASGRMMYGGGGRGGPPQQQMFMDMDPFLGGMGMDPGLDPSMLLGDPMLAAMMGQGPIGAMGMGGPMGMPRQGMGGPMDGMAALLGPPPDLLGMGPLGPMPMDGGLGVRPMGLGMGFGGGVGPMGMGMGMHGRGPFGGPLGMMGGPGGGRGPGGQMQQGQSQGPPQPKPSNDYSQNFVDTGQRPQNYLRDSHLTDRYEEYPRLKELITKKDELVARHATPPTYLKADLRSLRLSPETFGTKFDVLLVDPPWEEYVRRAPGMLKGAESWAWQDIQALEVEAIADTPSVLFLWCGSEEGLEAGRVCMQKWGFRRCEDIVWIKTNKEGGRNKYLQPANQNPDSVLVHTKEHCLMGMRGSLRRATDGHIIHTNIDTDVIVSEEPPMGSTQKPEELYSIIEHFCNGRRRLELFGEDHNIRPGWVTVGKSLSTSNFNPKVYSEHFRNRDGSVYVSHAHGSKPHPGSVNLLPHDNDVDQLRPRSPAHGGRD